MWLILQDEPPWCVREFILERHQILASPTANIDHQYSVRSATETVENLFLYRKPLPHCGVNIPLLRKGIGAARNISGIVKSKHPEFHSGTLSYAIKMTDLGKKDSEQCLHPTNSPYRFGPLA